MERSTKPTGPPSPLMRQDLELSLERRSINPLTLSAFQRILLTTDGTVTEILEAFAGESIRVVKLFQEVSRLDRAVTSLELSWGEEVLRRSILLQGRMSLVNFIYADSIIALSRLDDAVRDGLLLSKKPIGLLILERRIETFKEILDCGIEPAGPVADYFRIDESASVIFRTYRMFTNGRPIMVITEKFPASYFRDWDPTATHGAVASREAESPPVSASEEPELHRIVTGIDQFVRSELLGNGASGPLDPDADLLGGTLVQSDRLFALLAFITERFGVRFEDDELVAENFRTLGTIAAGIARRRRRRPASSD